MFTSETVDGGRKLVKIAQRSDQLASTITLDKNELYIISNGSIVTALVNDGLINFNVWNAQNPNAKPKTFAITPTESPRDIWYYQINGNVALVKYESTLKTVHDELWNLTHPAVQQILPNCDPFLTDEEIEMKSRTGFWFNEQLKCNWSLDTNSNSQYLVRRYENLICAFFVLVFDRLSSKFILRITMPENVGTYNMNMEIIGSGKRAKTVLTAQTGHPYQCFVYDMSTGQTLLTIPLGRDHLISSHFLFPKGELMYEDHLLGGVNVIRIECDGENWTTSTTFASYGHVEEYDEMKLIEVTDTQTLWQVDCNSTSYLNHCDYLLNDVDIHRLGSSY